jgi:hypothetical protein
MTASRALQQQARQVAVDEGSGGWHLFNILNDFGCFNLRVNPGRCGYSGNCPLAAVFAGVSAHGASGDGFRSSLFFQSEV